MTLSPTLHRAPEVEAVKEPAKEPAKQWRNKWLVTADFTGHCARCDRLLIDRAGDVNWTCCKVYPSKELADHDAEDVIRRNLAEGIWPDVHLGAFPIEAAP